MDILGIKVLVEERLKYPAVVLILIKRIKKGVNFDGFWVIDFFFKVLDGGSSLNKIFGTLSRKITFLWKKKDFLVHCEKNICWKGEDFIWNSTRIQVVHINKMRKLESTCDRRLWLCWLAQHLCLCLICLHGTENLFTPFKIVFKKIIFQKPTRPT